jgi:glycosyltransferase involved in cell wall biosynthesis
MNIAVNTRLLLHNRLDGIGWFMFESLKRITRNHPEHKFIFIFDRKYSDEFIFSDNIVPVVAYPQARHPLLWYLYFDWGIPVALRNAKADIFLSPDGWLSLRTNLPSIAVIHDLNFEHLPEFIPFHVRQYYYLFFNRFAKKAERIATVSEFTKQDLIKSYKISEDKIDVVYNGANEKYVPIDEKQKESVRSKYTNNCQYFLFIGTIHPRKNLKNLIRSFDKFKNSFSNNIKLLVVGDKKWWTKDLKDVFNNILYKEEIIFIGRLNDDELKNVIGAALAMMYVSFFEGFGIPILEAMYCGVPVITSNTSSMPEVGGDAAIYIDPYSVESITEAMIQIYKDEKLRNDLIYKGSIRKNYFSWDKTAEKLWGTIEKVIVKL